MDPDHELREIAEIEACLQSESSGLRERIVHDIGRFAVALLCVSRPKGSDFLELAGTGTLGVVWSLPLHSDGRACLGGEAQERADRIGITLKENVEHRYLIDPDVIVPFTPEKPQEWNEWDPDLAFLRIPPALAREIGAIGHGVFYNLGRDRKAGFNGWCIELRLLFGTPESSAKFTDIHADLQINGMFSAVDSGSFSSVVTPAPIRCEYDYLNLDVDVVLPGLPQNFGGVSGGGLWRVLVYRLAGTVDIAWVEELEGVAFHQSDLVNGHRVIRCHGPQSIGTLIRLLV